MQRSGLNGLAAEQIRILKAQMVKTVTTTTVAVAQEAHGLDIATAAICRDVVAREPVDAGASFEPTFV